MLTLAETGSRQEIRCNAGAVSGLQTAYTRKYHQLYLNVVSVFPLFPIIASSFLNQQRLGKRLEPTQTGLYQEKRSEIHTLCS